MNLTGIILAGGRSSRLGFNKAEIKIGEIPLFINQIFKLSHFCDEILICTSEENLEILAKELKLLKKYHKHFKSLSGEIRLPAITLITDDMSFKSLSTPKESSPILGIYTGLVNSKNFYSFVAGFDMPFISYNLLSNVINITENRKSGPEGRMDIVSIKTAKGFEALCSIYSKNCINIIRKNLEEKNYKISDIFPGLNTRIITQEELESLDIDELNFFNINTSKDYEKFKNLWAETGSEDSFVSKWKEFFYR